MNSKNYNKVVVIGLDGATYDLLAKWTAEGKLPNLKKIIDEGSFGLLKSVPNLNSAAAWSSFITGLNPGKHGIFFFHEHIDHSFKLKFLNATHRQGREIWEILSDAGKKVGVINVPMTYPSKQVNGFMVAGLDTPSPDSEGFTYPSDLYQHIIKHIGAYTIESDMGRKIRKGDLGGGIRVGLETIKNRTRATKFLLNNYQWDFFMVVFRAIDNVQHHYWRYLDPLYPLYEPKLALKYGNAILQIYEGIDEAIGEILDSIPNDTNIVVMSDHGSAPAEFGPHFFNHFLEKTGYLNLAVKENAGIGLTVKHQFKMWIENFIDLADIHAGGRVRQFLKANFFKSLSNLSAMKYYPDINWQKSLAYSPVARPEIWINLKGREPFGIVSEKDYDKVCDEIIVRLYEWRDPTTNKKVIKKAVKRSEAYSGPYVNKSADIIIQLYDHLITGIELPTKYVVKEVKQMFNPIKDYKGFIFGKHADNGIIITSGPAFKTGSVINGAYIVDIMPTILYLFGLELPYNLDGKILQDIIRGDFVSQNPVKIAGDGTGINLSSPESWYTSTEMEIIRKRLTDLGYVE